MVKPFTAPLQCRQLLSYSGDVLTIWQQPAPLDLIGFVSNQNA